MEMIVPIAIFCVQRVVVVLLAQLKIFETVDHESRL
jgi:hypothetical protein